MENTNLVNTENNKPSIVENAVELDLQIKAHANMAWQNLIEACRCLKRMRDTKLYEQLGYSSFGEYTEASLNIKERQAYTYISTYEKQGEAFLQSNASLGITKLSLLNAIPAPDRQDFVENNDIAGMSVAEVEALVKQNDGRAEQIELLSAENADKEIKINDAAQRIRELEDELEEAKNRPIEVAVAEPDKATLDRIRNDAAEKAQKEAEKTFKAEKKKLKDDFNAEKEKAVTEATAAANKELADYKAKMESADTAKAEAIKRAEELEKKLAISSSPEATKFTFFFEALDNDYQRIIESISNLKKDSPEIADKYAKAMERYQAVIGERFAAIGYKFAKSEQKTASFEKYPDSEDTGRCSACGAFASRDDAFCSGCGAKFEGDAKIKECEG